MQDDGKIMLPLKSNSRQPIKIHKNTVIGEGKSLLNAGNVERGDCTCGIKQRLNVRSVLLLR